MLFFSTCGTKIYTMKGLYSWKEIWSLKSLAMLKCENLTGLHAVQ